MFAAGNYLVVEVRLDHDVSGNGVNNLPCTAICAQTECFANAEGELILFVDVYHSAGFHTLCQCTTVNLIFGTLGIFIFPKGHGNILVFRSI